MWRIVRLLIRSKSNSIRFQDKLRLREDISWIKWWIYDLQQKRGILRWRWSISEVNLVKP